MASLGPDTMDGHGPVNDVGDRERRHGPLKEELYRHGILFTIFLLSILLLWEVSFKCSREIVLVGRIRDWLILPASIWVFLAAVALWLTGYLEEAFFERIAVFAVVAVPTIELVSLVALTSCKSTRWPSFFGVAAGILVAPPLAILSLSRRISARTEAVVASALATWYAACAVMAARFRAEDWWYAHVIVMVECEQLMWSLVAVGAWCRAAGGLDLLGRRSLILLTTLVAAVRMSMSFDDSFNSGTSIPYFVVLLMLFGKASLVAVGAFRESTESRAFHLAGMDEPDEMM